jgi:hypothetical protein
MKKSEDRRLYLEIVAGNEVWYRHCRSGFKDFFGKDTETVVINLSAEGQSSVWAEVPYMIMNLSVKFS